MEWMFSSRTRTASGAYGQVERPSRELDCRSRHRNNVFISATLYGEENSYPVTVRNLSESGALVEGPALSRAGTRFRLRRGSLEVAGAVMWQKGSNAGLQFDLLIAVDDWLPNAMRKHQALVDKMVHDVQLGFQKRRGPPSTHEQAVWNAERIALLVEWIAEEFSSDGRIVAEHSEKLQQLDIAVQHLRRLS